MKIHSDYLILLFLIFSFQSFSQDITTDTVLAGKYYNQAQIFREKIELDSALKYIEKAQALYLLHLKENDPIIGDVIALFGEIYLYASDYKKSLQCYFNALAIELGTTAPKDKKLARIYREISINYREKGEYEKSLEYIKKALSLKVKSLKNNHQTIAYAYIDIGMLYSYKEEYDKSFEYYYKALKIEVGNGGENNSDVAAIYNNLGFNYYDLGHYNKAIEYFQKDLQISLETLGAKHREVAISYNNNAMAYIKFGEYDIALEYCFKALNIQLEIFGQEYSGLWSIYINIGMAYKKKGDYAKSLAYYLKALSNTQKTLGKKHPYVTKTYNEIGNLFEITGDLEKALQMYQHALFSNLKNCTDSVYIALVPEIANYMSYKELLTSLQSKARIFANHEKTLTAFGTLSGLEIALKHYQACDTLISKTRQQISKQSDKITLGKKANEIYKEAIDVCLGLADIADKQGRAYQQYRQLAFYFSEKNKSAVLLESLAGKEAQKFAGIPDSLLEMEQNLEIDIAFYNKELATPQDLDSMHIITYRESLFKVNRTYDSLISVFETQFPEYSALKYSTKTSTVKQIQNMLNKHSAMISYCVGNSSITIFVVTKKSFDVFSVPKIKDFDTNLEVLRNAMLPTGKSDRMNYIDLGYSFYIQLFPFLNQNKAFEKITSLILIPDGQLSTLPFDALLTGQAYVDIADMDYYKDLPYLINQFDISYSYSATLFKNTFSKKTSKNGGSSNLIDWIGMAPVFDSESTAAITEYSSKLKKEIQKSGKDSILIRSFFNPDEDYIFPLPGTETEVKELFHSFESNNKTAEMKLRGDANESFIKSGKLSKYRIIHIATHSLVNTDKPELSCILLSQNKDTTIKNPSNGDLNTEQNEGILYQGEILNIRLNSDLVVLSACETGLGKITNGEGIIGLTRALLYAGTKNILVSLWQVSDASTTELMVSFYNNLFQSKSNNYAEALRKAKLQLINGGKFAHPYFWSSFVLIGK